MSEKMKLERWFDGKSGEENKIFETTGTDVSINPDILVAGKIW